MNAEARARLYIWDLDLLVARHDLRDRLHEKLHDTPYRQIVKRRLGRFVVLYLSAARTAAGAPNAVWVHVGLDNLAKTIRNAKVVSQQDGMSGTEIAYKALPDAASVIQAELP